MQTGRTRRSWLATAMIVPMLMGCGSDAVRAEGTNLPDTSSATEQVARRELYGASPIENLWSPRVQLEVPDLPPGWNGARIALLSDFQLGLWEDNGAVAAAAVQRAVDADPDIIVLLGDYLAPGGDATELARILALLRGRTAVAVLGDRDVRTDSVASTVTTILREAGIRTLRNQSTPIVLRGDTAWIAGADPEILSESRGTREYLFATMAPATRAPILLAHDPAVVGSLPDDRFPIVLSGATFCGDVAVPGTRRLANLRSDVLPGALVPGVDRLFRAGASTLLITCGTGYSFVPVRFGAAPEVPLLTLIGLGLLAPPDSLDTSEVPDSLIQRFQGEPTDSI